MSNPTTDTPGDQMGPHLDAALTALESAGAIMARLVFLRGEEDARALQTLRLALHLVQYLRCQHPPTGRQTDLERVALADRGSEADLDPSRIPPRRIEQPWFRRRP